MSEMCKSQSFVAELGTAEFQVVSDAQKNSILEDREVVLCEEMSFLCYSFPVLEAMDIMNNNVITINCYQLQHKSKLLHHGIKE